MFASRVPTLDLVQARDLLEALRLQVRRLAPGEVPLGRAADLWATYDAIERQAAAAKTLLAARVDESRSWARAGARSPGAPPTPVRS